MSEKSSTNQYTLGSGERETERLVAQAALIEDRTRKLLIDSGIRAAMAVLDLGSGAGDVSLLAREFVGEAGKVVGVDKDPLSVARARARVEEAGFTNVRFIEADLAQGLAFDEEFDAIVGRRVLMYLPDRERILRALIPHLRPGGIVAFAEVDTEREHAPIEPSSGLYDRIARWAWQAFRVTGAETRMGSKLEALLLDCGLEHPVVDVPPPSLETSVDRALARIDNQTNVVRSMLPLIREHHIAPAEELDRFEEYASQLRREVEQGIRTLVIYQDHHAWARRTG